MSALDEAVIAAARAVVLAEYDIAQGAIDSITLLRRALEARDAASSHTERCDNCRFFRPVPQHLDGLLGRCLRHAPQPVPKPIPITQNASIHWHWPLILIDDWCGEWTTKQMADG